MPTAAGQGGPSTLQEEKKEKTGKKKPHFHYKLIHLSYYLFRRKEKALRFQV